MGVDRPGSRPWHTTIKAELAAPVTADTGIPLGGRLHDRVIDHRIKPGTRAYRAALMELAAEAPEAPEEPEGDGDGDGDMEGFAATGDPAPWAGFSTHSQLDNYLTDNGITPPEGWETLKVAEKKAWLDENATIEG